jgi:hypothetical protein
MEENMSLIDEYKAACVLLEKKREPDGEGGFYNTWIEGAEFDAAFAFSTSIEARRAEKEGVTSLYAVTTSKNIVLEYHDVFRRETDNKIFRVTSDGDDSFTPRSSSLNMRQVTAEEWSLL